jgi:hypothetical protein
MHSKGKWGKTRNEGDTKPCFHGLLLVVANFFLERRAQAAGLFDTRIKTATVITKPFYS